MLDCSDLALPEAVVTLPLLPPGRNPAVLNFWSVPIC